MLKVQLLLQKCYNFHFHTNQNVILEFIYIESIFDSVRDSVNKLSRFYQCNSFDSRELDSSDFLIFRFSGEIFYDVSVFMAK